MLNVKNFIRNIHGRSTDNNANGNGNGNNENPGTYSGGLNFAPGAPGAPSINRVKAPSDPYIGTSAEQADSMYQKQVGTSCLIASTTMILRQQGVHIGKDLINFEGVLFDVAQIILIPGKRVLHNPRIVDPIGNPMYHLYIDISNTHPGIPANMNFNDKAKLKKYFLHEQADPPSQNKNRVFQIKNIGDAAPQGGTFEILKHYGKTGHSGNAYSLYDIAEELKRGQYMILNLDPNEIWGDDYPTSDQRNIPTVILHGVAGTPDQSGATGHNVVLLAIDFTNPNEPMALINDPGDPRNHGRARRIPLTQLIAAMGDYQFDYIASGAGDAARKSLQDSRQSLMWDIANWYGRHSESRYIAEQFQKSAFFMSAVRNPALMQLMEADFPGIALRASQFVAQHDKNQRAFEKEYGLPLGYSDALYGNADAYEFDKPLVINAINTVSKNELKGIMNRSILEQAGFLSHEIDGYLNETYLRRRGFTDAEIEEILNPPAEEES